MKRSTMIMAAVGALAVAGITTAAIADNDDFAPRGKMGGKGECERGERGERHHQMRGHHGDEMGGFAMMGGPGHMQRFMKDGNFDLKLTPERVKDIMEGKLAWQGNPNLKVGEVTTDKDGQIIAQLVTKDNSLVQTFKIDPKTGARTIANP